MFRLFIIFCYAVVQVYGLFRARLQKEVLKSGGVSPVAPDETHAAIPLTFVNDQVRHIVFGNLHLISSITFSNNK